MAITTAISDLVKSFYELVSSVINAAIGVANAVFNAVVGFVTGIFALFSDIFSGVADIAHGVSKFVLGNVFLIAIGVLLAFAYVRYTASGQRVATAKKTT